MSLAAAFEYLLLVSSGARVSSQAEGPGTRDLPAVPLPLPGDKESRGWHTSVA